MSEIVDDEVRKGMKDGVHGIRKRERKRRI